MSKPSRAGALVRHYLFSVACAAGSLGLRLILSPIAGTAAPYITFFPAVLLAGWYGGFGPGLASTFVCGLAALYFVVPPLHTFVIATPADALGMFLFVCVGIAISWLNHTARKARLAGDSRLESEVTERARAQEERDEARRSREEVLSSISDAVVGIDRQWRYTYVNDQTKRMLRRRREDLLGKVVWEVFPEAHGSYSERGMRRVMEERVTERWQDYNEPLQLWYEVTAYPSPGGITLYIRDISQQKNSEVALAEREERLRLALDAANEGLWDWNVNNGSMYFGPRYAAMLGYGPDELTPTRETKVNLTHPDDRAAVERQQSEQIGQQQGKFRIEFRMRKKDGEYIWVQSIGKVITWTEDGKPARMVGTISDITERRALEAQVLLSQRLEGIGRLAGGIAHDFNNLLTVINGYTEMLLGDVPPDAEWRDSLQEIRTAGARAASLTQQLLAFSRKQLLQPLVMNLNRTVADADRMLRRLIGEHIKLETRLAPDLGNIVADPGQLLQVILNLAVNSRDAMPNGGTLMVETANITFDDRYASSHPGVHLGQHVMLAITDDGTGMAPEVRERVFEPFFTTKPKGAGTGLGLSTVYGIVKQSGGWIWVYSEPGQGSTFKIYFPRTDNPVPQAQAQTKTDVRGTETVLVVEDQADVRNLAVAVLERFGYTVHSAADAADAVEFCAAYPDTIHLLLTDVVMPGMNGRELANVLTGRRTGLRVIFMSGYTENAIAHHGVLDTGVAYLQKPFTPERLAETVREVLGAPASLATILVADDDDTVRGLLQTMLTGEGYSVIEATNGRQAIQRVTETPLISLLITDLVMPDQEGLETIRILHDTHPRLKVIAISGAFGGDLLAAAHHFGAKAVLKKPVELEELLRTVREVLAGD